MALKQVEVMPSEAPGCLLKAGNREGQCNNMPRYGSCDVVQAGQETSYLCVM